jgi:hypothetical protein
MVEFGWWVALWFGLEWRNVLEVELLVHLTAQGVKDSRKSAVPILF